MGDGSDVERHGRRVLDRRETAGWEGGVASEDGA